uniref:phosphopantothenoylcysteine decarboxylase n=1 Tax=Leersia perrieri TaxID=77586 RepID=A0A0D9WMZ0_9ORYZ
MTTSEPVQETLALNFSQPSKPRVLLAASGSVAAIKFESLCRSFSEWAEVRAVATKASLHFTDRKSLPSDIILYTDDDEWSTWKKIGDEVLHIELRKWADIMVIAPLSANTLAKIAGGLCDNLLTCIVRAWDYSKPLFVAPAMNTFMWNNPFTNRHLETINQLAATSHLADAATILFKFKLSWSVYLSKCRNKLTMTWDRQDYKAKMVTTKHEDKTKFR